jgi:hypothetical protein
VADLLQLDLRVLVPWVLGLYSLAFIAGGLYYLEQRVARIRDQFPRRGLLASLTGHAALAIGILMALSVASHFYSITPEARLGALVAATAGVGFWIYRVSFDLTPMNRIRDGVLVLVCAAIAVITMWWIETA